MFTVIVALFSPHQASFSYFNNPPTNMQRLITSGGFVTFSLTRDSADLFGYGFVIQVTPIPGKHPHWKKSLDINLVKSVPNNYELIRLHVCGLMVTKYRTLSYAICYICISYLTKFYIIYINSVLWLKFYFCFRWTSADISNPNNCDQGAGYGCESYHYNPVITKTEVIYIVAAIFGVALVIIVPAVIIYCYVRQRGLTRRWQERRLKDGAPNTAATSLNGSMRSAPLSSRPWQSDISKQPFASIKKSPASSRRWSRPPTDDEESVFDGMSVSLSYTYISSLTILILIHVLIISWNNS